jgi:hypothetical protein
MRERAWLRTTTYDRPSTRRSRSVFLRPRAPHQTQEPPSFLGFSRAPRRREKRARRQAREDPAAQNGGPSGRRRRRRERRKPRRGRRRQRRRGFAPRSPPRRLLLPRLAGPGRPRGGQAPDRVVSSGPGRPEPVRGVQVGTALSLVPRPSSRCLEKLAGNNSFPPSIAREESERATRSSFLSPFFRRTSAALEPRAGPAPLRRKVERDGRPGKATADRPPALR